jgi:putative endonuclease
MFNNRPLMEVKQRRGAGFGGAVGAVDAEKRRRVRRAAQAWLSRHPQPEYVRVGFEVVAVQEGRLVRIPASLSED